MMHVLVGYMTYIYYTCCVYAPAVTRHNNITMDTLHAHSYDTYSYTHSARVWSSKCGTRVGLPIAPSKKIAALDVPTLI